MFQKLRGHGDELRAFIRWCVTQCLSQFLYDRCGIQL